ncbi:MAG: Obg family GTPase CgtA [Spirochaetaceae bacterium]|nr:Obg family GTPase CgtA [Spirochaetaceae bacterium]
MARIGARFVDRTEITVSSGSGGNGAVSFRREKYVPRGGPDGGDGGRGGDVVFTVRHNVHTLAHLAGRHHYRAEDGAPGRRRRQHGANGKEVRIPVPPGTLVRDAGSGEVLHDLASPDEEWLCLQGGAGGAGNARFATSVRRAPRFAKPGRPGIVLQVRLELRSIADVGFVGLPNAGKSTLLAALTNARPKIAAYPFTTIVPGLGTMRVGDAAPVAGNSVAPGPPATTPPTPPARWSAAPEVVLADIPGIVAGASGGTGLGLQFLDHIARARMLAYVIDLTGDGDPLATLEAELRAYDAALIDRPRVLVGTKQDLDGDGALRRRLRRRYPDDEVVTVSAHDGTGMDDLRGALGRLARAA